MDFDPRCSFDDVAVRDYAVRGDEKAAAARKRIILGIESFNRNRRRFDALDKLR